jgi:hypothetical protein
METVLRGLRHDSCLLFTDDVIVFGRTFQEYLLKVRKVFQRFRDVSLKPNPKKCQLLQEGSFLGPCMYYRRFISGFAMLQNTDQTH